MSGSIDIDNVALPNERNAFYARFEQKTNIALTSIRSDLCVSFLGATIAEFRSAFLRGKPRKATGLME